VDQLRVFVRGGGGVVFQGEVVVRDDFKEDLKAKIVEEPKEEEEVEPPSDVSE
jgi:hypothetical protein